MEQEEADRTNRSEGEQIDSELEEAERRLQEVEEQVQMEEGKEEEEEMPPRPPLQRGESNKRRIEQQEEEGSKKQSTGLTDFQKAENFLQGGMGRAALFLYESKTDLDVADANSLIHLALNRLFLLQLEVTQSITALSSSAKNHNRSALLNSQLNVRKLEVWESEMNAFVEGMRKLIAERQ
jgi:hypothetical protein